MIYHVPGIKESVRGIDLTSDDKYCIVVELLSRLLIYNVTDVFNPHLIA